MIGDLQGTAAPFVVEKVARDVATDTSDSIVIAGVPSIHASRIDIQINSGAAGNAKLRIYSAGTGLSRLVTLGALSAATTAGFTWGIATGEEIGQSYDVIVDLTTGTSTATAWTRAR